MAIDIQEGFLVITVHFVISTCNYKKTHLKWLLQGKPSFLLGCEKENHKDS